MIIGNRRPGLFQSTRLSRASTQICPPSAADARFQSTRLSRASTSGGAHTGCHPVNFNPQGSREPRPCALRMCVPAADFNPQGSREPRPDEAQELYNDTLFQSTRLSRASTLHLPDILVGMEISIHKALASLDSKIIQTYSTSPLTFYALCSSLPSSTNSVHSPSPLSRPFPLFFRCESPWHFMSAWHSHLV